MGSNSFWTGSDGYFNNSTYCPFLLSRQLRAFSLRRTGCLNLRTTTFTINDTGQSWVPPFYLILCVRQKIFDRGGGGAPGAPPIGRRDLTEWVHSVSNLYWSLNHSIENYNLVIQASSRHLSHSHLNSRVGLSLPYAASIGGIKV